MITCLKACKIIILYLVLPGSKLIPECGVIGAPPVSPKTFQEYVIPFWFRESIFRQDADLGFLSDQSRSTDNTGKLIWINVSVYH